MTRVMDRTLYRESSPLVKSEVLQIYLQDHCDSLGTDNLNLRHVDTDNQNQRHNNSSHSKVVANGNQKPDNNTEHTPNPNPNPNNDAMDDENNEQQGSPGRVSGFKLLAEMSGRQRWILFLNSLAMFGSHFMFSLLGLFFPLVANRKGMGMGMVGIVYGIFQATIFITSPFFGTYLGKLGPRFVFFAGIFMAGSCNILFGCLEYCPGGTPFTVMSLLLRVVEAVGCSGFMNAAYASVSSEFKENVAFTFGILETGVGLGYLLGPTIGGFLYELGGFGLPFHFAGAMALLNGLAMYKFLPAVNNPPPKHKGSILTLFGNPMILISACCVFFGAGGMSAYDGTFSKRVRQLGFSVGMTGVLFGALSVVYMVMSIFWGYLCDTRNIQAPLIIGGQFVFGMAFLFIGPSFLLPFIPFNITSMLIGLGCLGISYGCTLVPTMKCMLVGALEIGFEDNINTYALVAGLFTSVMTSGAAVAPIIVGRLIEDFGYPVAYTAPGLCSLCVMAIALAFFLYRKYRQ